MLTSVAAVAAPRGGQPGPWPRHYSEEKIQSKCRNKFENKNIVGAGFIINLPELKGDQKLISKGIKIHSLMEF